MLDFTAVQQRGMARAIVVAQGGEPPSHIYVLDPLVQQLSGEDYCAANGAMLTPPEATSMAQLLHQVGHHMDGMEAAAAQAKAEAEEAQETAGVLYNQLMRYHRIHKWVAIVVVAAALYALQMGVLIWIS